LSNTFGEIRIKEKDRCDEQSTGNLRNFERVKKERHEQTSHEAGSEADRDETCDQCFSWVLQAAATTGAIHPDTACDQCHTHAAADKDGHAAINHRRDSQTCSPDTCCAEAG
jgi:hypothetical protein